MKTAVISGKLVNADFIKSFKGKSEEEIIALKQKLENQIRMSEFFIYKFYTYAPQYEKLHTSYGLKHQVENYFKVCDHAGIKFKGFENTLYVSNDALKLAMFNFYYTCKSAGEDSPNLIYKYRYIGPKFHTDLGYEVPLTEADWKKIFVIE